MADIKVVVIGGQEQFSRNRLFPKLRGMGIDPAWHYDWDAKTKFRDLPKGCEAVIVIKGMVSHQMADRALLLARKIGIKFVVIPRKFSHAKPILERVLLVQDKAATTAATAAPSIPAVIEIPKTLAPIPVQGGAEVKEKNLKDWVWMSLEDNPLLLKDPEELAKAALANSGHKEAPEDDLLVIAQAAIVRAIREWRKAHKRVTPEYANQERLRRRAYWQHMVHARPGDVTKQSQECLAWLRVVFGCGLGAGWTTIARRAYNRGGTFQDVADITLDTKKSIASQTPASLQKVKEAPNNMGLETPKKKAAPTKPPVMQMPAPNHDPATGEDDPLPENPRDGIMTGFGKAPEWAPVAAPQATVPADLFVRHHAALIERLEDLSKQVASLHKRLDAATDAGIWSMLDQGVEVVFKPTNND